MTHINITELEFLDNILGGYANLFSFGEKWQKTMYTSISLNEFL